MDQIRSRMKSSRRTSRMAHGLVLLLGLTCSAAVTAGPAFYCTATIQELGLGQDGSVDVKLSSDNDVHGICNLETQMPGGIVASACKAAYATLLANRLTQTPVRLYYYSNDTTKDCMTFPSWKNMPVYFVEVPGP